MFELSGIVTKFIKRENKILAICLLGLSIRIVFIYTPGFKYDVDAWFSWAMRLESFDFGHFYSQQIWTNYTPGFLYLLALIGFARHIFTIEPTNFYALLKLPSILAEIGLATVVYQQSIKKLAQPTALFLAGLILFNPALIFNSSIWGQIDGLLSFFMVLTVLFFKRGQLLLSSILLGLSFLIKPQAIAILPVFAIFFIFNFSFKKLLLFFSGFIVTLVLGFLPFYSIHTIDKSLELIIQMGKDYPFNSLFAFNFWGLFGFWQSDLQTYLSFSLKNWGYLLINAFWLICLFWLQKRSRNFYTIAALSCLSFFFLPTRVHERYLYPAIPFLILAFLEIKSKLFIYLSLGLSLIYLLDLYLVFCYYNVVHLKYPFALFNLYLFNLLQSNARLFAGVSTILFLGLTYLLLKNHDQHLH